MNFIIYDIVLLVLFAIFISLFLYTKKKNLKKEGLLFLYKTSWGIKLINYVGNKYKKSLKILSYISIGLGYCLMVSMLYLFGKIIWLYVAYPAIVREIKIPPIMPLVPYLPQIFKLDFLPPFYFTYWIIILAVIAITHEFAHGIFAAYNKIKVKTTGFGFFPFFLPVFLAAFVELDEEKMKKKNKFSQMAILSAGTFANILTAIFFFLVLWIFFSLAFTPSGIVFDTYSYSAVGISTISAVNTISFNNLSYEKLLDLVNETGMTDIQVAEDNYVITKDLLKVQKNTEDYVILYYDAPAINAGLTGAISEIDGVKIDSIKKLTDELAKKSPMQEVVVTTISEDKSKNYKIILGEHPENKNSPLLGIGFVNKKREGLMGKVYQALSSFKKPHVYYQPKFDGVSWFVYNLLWWIVLISVSVALVNMLPVGIFDGGRFFYLTVLAITKSEKKAKNFFAFSTYFILFLVLLLLVFWAVSFL